MPNIIGNSKINTDAQCNGKRCRLDDLSILMSKKLHPEGQAMAKTLTKDLLQFT
jgi:hypothetical protein